MSKHEPVTLYRPLDEGKLRYLQRAITGVPDSQATIRYENDSHEDGGFSEGFILSVPGLGVIPNDIVNVPGDEGQRALAEYLTAALNFKDEILVALTQVFEGIAVRQPYALEDLLTDLATAPGPSSRLDDLIHDHFDVRATFAHRYTTSLDAAVALFRAALPTYTYMIYDTRTPVAKVMRPPVNPDGRIDDGGSWSTTYEATSHNEAMALVQATVIAKIANP
jgi:hypothetical protein